MEVRRIASLKTADDFQRTIERLGIAADLAFDATVEQGADAPLARPYDWRGGRLGNRFAILPMEGWDGTADGLPTDLTRRRWENFGLQRRQDDLGGRGGRGPP